MNGIKHIFWLLAAFMVTSGVITACHGNSGSQGHASRYEFAADGRQIDSVMYVAQNSRDMDRLLQLADSFEANGDLTAMEADFYRGVASKKMGRLRAAEFYWQRAVNAETDSNQMMSCYFSTASNLAILLLTKGDYEGALKAALPAVAKMEQMKDRPKRDLARLLNSIGCCQLNLGRVEEAARSYEQALGYYCQFALSDSTENGYYFAVVGTGNTAVDYLNANRFSDAWLWTDRTDSLLACYEAKPTADAAFSDEFHARISLYRAQVLQEQGKRSEAAAAYDKALRTAYGRSLDGQIDANDYLLAAHRYGEAADNLNSLDRWFDEWGVEMSLDNIRQWLFMKYRANVGAGRKDMAIRVGSQILDALDSAIVRQKRSDAAELATIYDTQQKEAEIAKQQLEIAEKDASLSKLWWIATAIALMLITAFFVIYTVVRRRAAHRLAEMKATQERIESELRIARDIQMSMVPSTFLQREGLDMYASMSPAKEVGGDLYGYLLTDDKLYFCVGDVSGKGVPASLFMAQATRLFRTLAAQGMMPAEICTRMNEALSGEDNVSGMFVTFFLGLVDLSTGHLHFCNAGHNPPVIGGGENHGDFLSMIPNAPIGLWQGLQFEGEEIDSIKGRPLFVYTDGLNEAENAQQQQFGDGRMLDILRNTRFDSARQVIETLAAEVERHRNGADPNDDLTMFCLRIL